MHTSMLADWLITFYWSWTWRCQVCNIGMCWRPYTGSTTLWEYTWYMSLVILITNSVLNPLTWGHHGFLYADPCTLIWLYVILNRITIRVIVGYLVNHDEGCEWPRRDLFLSSRGRYLWAPWWIRTEVNAWPCSKGINKELLISFWLVQSNSRSGKRSWSNSRMTKYPCLVINTYIVEQRD